ncbi:SAG-related sequence SRS26E [Toxoplasma gondii MAS]|uniref:SAG-related sequence SRS26E n=1 Tax=Toxoplasma gondii MAS TaxID=943118 RepID=A0A086PSR8_TOXGO|nr:SAG-related sequence SRS26E [Toxoplasma gondii MAS]
MGCNRYLFFLSISAAFCCVAGSPSVPEGLPAETDRHERISSTLPDPPQEQHCSMGESPITIQIAADETEATFKCADPLTTLDPADCTDPSSCSPTVATREELHVPMIYDDVACNKAKPLTDVFPGATREDDTDKNVFKLIIPKDNRPQKDVWYQCTSGQRNTPCKVQISVAAALADPPENHQCSRDGGSIEIEVLPEQTEATFKCGSTLITLEPADCSSDSCSPLGISEKAQRVPMICEDENCSVQKPLNDIFPGATRTDDTVNNVYKLTIPKEDRITKVAWYHCKQRARQNPCKVKINVTAAPLPPPTSPENRCTAADGELDVSASPDKPLKFVCAKELSLEPPNKETVYDNSDGQCQKAVQLSTLVEAELTEDTQEAALVQKDTTYTLTVKKLPPKQTLLCYKCVAREARMESLRKSNSLEANNGCLVKVTIDADPTATTTPNTPTESTPTETPSIPPTSSAVAPRGTLAVTCGLVVVSLWAIAICAI